MNARKPALSAGLAATLAVATVLIALPAHAALPRVEAAPPEPLATSSSGTATSTDSPSGAKGTASVNWGRYDAFTITVHNYDTRADGRGAIIFVYRDTNSNGRKLYYYDHITSGSGVSTYYTDTYGGTPGAYQNPDITKSIQFKECNGGT